ncbi:MAG TPA: hypothetical protein VG167_15760 [Verrucomicrobiae bacterium]|nr:hypothetical protein [Verrucomicrobiae bacterium]
MYGAPSELNSLRRVVTLMQQHNLGNGFDPGPAARAVNKPSFDYLATIGWPVMAYPGCADMQIKGGCALGPEDAAALAPLDRAGIFNAVQLGEWGYYFHNLACNEAWWRDVYGKEFAAHKHLMKPPGLAGYDRRPSSRQECYDVLKDYFTSRSRALLNRTISVTGHSHYEAYAAEWGARCVGLEVGENIAFTQSKLAFARGASRQWQRPWSVQVSPWFNGACTTSGPLRQEPGGARGLDAGHSLSFYERMWLHAWFAGAAMVTPENSIAIFFEPDAQPAALTAHGRKAAEVFRFMREHQRGIPWTPVAIVLDHLAGYNAYMDKPWGILEPTAGDREIRDLFDHQLFPGSDHIHTPPDRINPEASYLRPTPYGESFDVLLTTASPEVLAAYPVILLAGDIDFDRPFLDSLTQALRRGSRLLMSVRHQKTLGTEFEVLKRQGTIEVLAPWINPQTGRASAISDQVLRRITQEFQPLRITGDPIQYQLNRTERGWVVELVNNMGVIKTPNLPAVIDPKAVAHVRLRPQTPCLSAVEWHSRRTYEKPTSIEVTLGPGSSEFVEFIEP